MKSAFENRLDTLCRNADVELPAADFNVRVMSRIRKKQRQDVVQQGIGVAAVMVLFWLLLPQIEGAMPVVAASVLLPLDQVIRLLVALSRSPITYVFGAALVAYLFLRFLPRISLT